MNRLPASIDPQAAAGLLQPWGFLAHSELPDRLGPSFLLVSIRPAPTLEHFDPEQIDYWVNDAGRGTATNLSRQSKLPLDAPTTWGMIRVTDRLRVTNEWLSFGGRVQADVIEGAVVAVFSSTAPLLRRGGHSQGWDEGAPSVGAFFAKVRAAAGADRQFEALETAADPLARFGCFVAEQARRYRHSEVLQKLEEDTWRVVQHEEHRLKAEHPADLERGLQLLAALDAASSGGPAGDAPSP